MAPWNLAGTYLEACNCEAICPCRKVGGVPGGRSTYGECLGALSWHIQEGADGDLDLASLAVVIAFRYHDDEPRSPWRWELYVDDRATPPQRDSLASIFTGRREGDSRDRFPWTSKPSDLLAVTPARIELDHTPRMGWFRVGREVTIRVARAVEDLTTVSCVIPGHDRPGTEVVTAVMALDGAVAHAEFAGRCGFEATFAYAGPA